MKARNVVRGFAAVLASLFMVVLISGPSAAADVKFGKINYDVIQKKSAKISAGINDIQQMQQETQAKMNSLVKDMTVAQDRLSKEKDSLSPQDKEKLENLLNEKKQELESEQQALRVKLAFKRDSLTKTISTLVDEIIADIAKKEGIAVVFRSDAVKYGPDIVDISEKVVKALDEAPLPGEPQPEQKPKQPKPEQKPEQKNKQ
jgi:Skp family chaperone for outer membrane proteins